MNASSAAFPLSMLKIAFYFYSVTKLYESACQTHACDVTGCVSVILFSKLNKIFAGCLYPKSMYSYDKQNHFLGWPNRCIG